MGKCGAPRLTCHLPLGGVAADLGPFSIRAGLYFTLIMLL